MKCSSRYMKEVIMMDIFIFERGYYDGYLHLISC